jgi:UDP-N-acetylmuramyl pentapeptide synthase
VGGQADHDLPTDAERVTYGFSHDCDFAGDMSRGDDGHITLIINGEEIETGSANQTFSMNLLAASAVASTLGMSWEVIQERVASFQAVTGRCRVEVKNGVTVIDDTYNANLTSTLAALDYLFDIPSEGERHFIFGDMLELGDASESHHQKATASTAANGIDSRHFDGKKHLAEVIRENVSPGDVVLFKGSRGMALESVIEELFGD